MLDVVHVNNIAEPSNNELIIVRSAYICSTINQFYKSLIFKKQSKNEYGVLVFLYSKTKLPDKEHLLAEAKEIMDEVIFVELPAGSHELNIYKIRKIEKIYTKLLKRLKPEQVTLFSFETHYSLFCSLCSERKIKLIVAEEGTGSYKYLTVPEPPKPEYRTFKKHLIELYNIAWKDTLLGHYLMRPLYYIVRDIQKTGRAFYITARYILKNENRHYYAVEKNKRYAAFLKPWRNFDTLRLDISGPLEKYFEINKIIYNEVPEEVKYDKEVKELIEKYKIDSTTVIFASQMVWGVEGGKLFELVSQVLDVYSKKENKSIIIKAHPREDASIIKNALDKLGNDNIQLMESNSYPIERIIKFSQPHAVLSIGSSSIVYSYPISKNTKYISIAHDILALLKKNKLVNHRNRRFFSQTLETLVLFEHVQFTRYFK